MSTTLETTILVGFSPLDASVFVFQSAEVISTALVNDIPVVIIGTFTGEGRVELALEEALRLLNLGFSALNTDKEILDYLEYKYAYELNVLNTREGYIVIRIYPYYNTATIDPISFYRTQHRTDILISLATANMIFLPSFDAAVPMIKYLMSEEGLSMNVSKELQEVFEAEFSSDPRIKSILELAAMNLIKIMHEAQSPQLEIRKN